MNKESPEIPPSLEELLAALTPRPASLNRDQLMYRAGYSAGAAASRPVRHAWLWPSATAITSVAAVVLAAVLIVRPPVYIERVVRLPQPVPTAPLVVDAAETPSDDLASKQSPLPLTQELPSPRLAATSIQHPSEASSQLEYFELRRRVLKDGVEALPAPSSKFDSGDSANQRSPRKWMTAMLPSELRGDALDFQNSIRLLGE